MAVKKPTLKQFATPTAGSSNIKLPALPKLGELTKMHGFAAGIAQHDNAMEEWRQKIERLLNERLAEKTTVPSSTV